jgi:hypothetical protein
MAKQTESARQQRQAMNDVIDCIPMQIFVYTFRLRLDGGMETRRSTSEVYVRRDAVRTTSE